VFQSTIKKYTLIVMSFEKDGYIFKRQFLSKELCDIGKRIALHERDSRYYVQCNQVEKSHAGYRNSFMENLLKRCQPQVEKCTGLKLFPTYSYYRIYEPGNILRDHTDRPECEITVTLTLGFNYVNKADDYRWPIHVFIDDEKKYFNCDVGDAMIYRGCELKHGREQFDVGDDSYHVNVFLHYSRNRVHLYDGHDDLGI
jgi:hypothetical protein